MASGSLSIILEEPMSWEQYPESAIKWVEKLNATIIDEADTIDERIKKIEYEGLNFWLSYDDFQSSLTLEPIGGLPDVKIQSIAEQIFKL